MKKADLRFAKIDADLLTNNPLLCRVPGGIRTPDLPLRRRTHYPAVQRKRIQFGLQKLQSMGKYIMKRRD